MMISLLGVILMGNDWRAAQAAMRLNVGGRVSPSGVKFSWWMVLRMMLSFCWRVMAVFAAAGSEVFAELDDVIFIVEIFGVMDFFDADVVEAAELTDVLRCAGEVGYAVVDFKPALGRECGFGEFYICEEFADLFE